MQRVLYLLRADEVDVTVEAAGGQYAALAGDRLGAGADDDVDARLGVRVARLADRRDAAVAQADIGLVDAGMVDDQRVGDDGVDRPFGPRRLGLPHPVADHFAAAELDLLTIDREIALDLDDQVGVGEPQSVAGGWPVHGGVIRPADLNRHQSAPMTC